MSDAVQTQVVDVVVGTVGSGLKRETVTPETKLVGNVLDSMAVMNLIMSLEDHFGFSFRDEELSAEAFETVATLTALVRSKLA
ncbi:MAG TPA: acyl carrier protein [bacterium]